MATGKKKDAPQEARRRASDTLAGGVHGQSVSNQSPERQLKKQSEHQQLWRATTYIDGFNLYFGLRDAGFRRFYWLNLERLSKSFLKEDTRLSRCNYFTARIRSERGVGHSAARQSVYLDALAAQPLVQIHYGHYLPKRQRCLKCGAEWTKYEEKMTDVNIATQLLADAYEDRFDVAFVVSGDSDLTTPVRLVRERFPNKRVIIAFPPRRRSKQLKEAAHGSFVIGANKLRVNQLPETVRSITGYPLTRPTSWR